MSKPDVGRRSRSRCPFCAADIETDLACGACGATVLERATWVVIASLRLLPPGASVLHHRPGLPLARRLRALVGGRYDATLDPGATSPAADVPFHALNLVEQASRLAAERYDLIIVTEGLAEAGAAVPSVLEALAAAVRPGGTLLFGGDVVDAAGNIVSPALALAAGARSGKEASFAGLVRRQFGRECRVRAGEELDAEVFEAAGISPTIARRVTPHTPFRYQA